MNREIKFRAWDIGGKEMINSIQMLSFVKGGDIIVTGKGGSINGRDFELMQFTGLKDKNGKEIYEGDIVNVDGRNDAHLCEFVQKDSGGRFQFTHPKKGVWGCFPKPKIEIIGNIYENPDLITPTRLVSE